MDDVFVFVFVFVFVVVERGQRDIVSIGQRSFFSFVRLRVS